MYLAARYGRRAEMLEVAHSLTERGHEVTSRWISAALEAVDDGVRLPGTALQSAAFALEDIEDIGNAQAFVLFTEAPGAVHRGGRFVELGIALTSGLLIFVCGPPENIFCCLPQIEHVDDVPALLALFAQEAPYARH